MQVQFIPVGRLNLRCNDFEMRRVQMGAEGADAGLGELYECVTGLGDVPVYLRVAGPVVPVHGPHVRAGDVDVFHDAVAAPGSTSTISPCSFIR